jgi:hypothetical protein
VQNHVWQERQLTMTWRIRRRTAIIYIAAIVVELAVSGVLKVTYADEPLMPTYDIAAFCRNHVEEKACVGDQYYTRHVVSDMWLSVLPAVRTECIAINRWNDYDLLQICIVSHENDAKVQAR